MKFGSCVLVAFGCLSAVGCGTSSPPDAPTLQLPFTSSATSPVLFNSTQGVQVGTTGFFGFGLLNAGTQSLVIQSVAYAGDATMSLGSFTSALPATLAFNDEFVVPLVCSPAAAETYSGTVSIVSNAANGPQTLVYLTCTGTP